MKAFKVVKRVSRSIYGPATLEALQRTRYRIGQVTRRQNQGAFALFASLEAAEAFANKNGKRKLLYAILECEYTQAIPDHFSQDELGSSIISEDEPIYLWKWRQPGFRKGRPYFHGIRYRIEVPLQTVFGETVLPIREV